MLRVETLNGRQSISLFLLYIGCYHLVFMSVKKRPLRILKASNSLLMEAVRKFVMRELKDKETNRIKTQRGNTFLLGCEGKKPLRDGWFCLLLTFQIPSVI